MSLKSQTFTAIRWTTLAMVGSAGLQFGQIMILARILEPADFGLMAIVIAIMAFVQVFNNLGVSSAIIHYQNISQDQLSSLFWLSVAVGVGLMLLVIVTGPLVSTYVFNQPALDRILILISVNILFVALGQQVRVMAEKALRFSVLAKVELASSLAGFICAVVWAWKSPSVYALVAGVLVNGLTQTTLLWLLASRGWRPSFRLRFGEIGHFLKFGGYIMANDFVNSFNRQADVLIAGRIFPAATIGFYSLPRNLGLMIAGVINPIITRVGLPVMARSQDDKTFLKSVYLKTMRMTASVNFPIYTALAIWSEEVVMVIFGEKWVESAPLLVYLAIWGMFRSCGSPVGSLLLAAGKADLSFKWNLALLFVVFPSLWLASQFGVVGLAAGQAALMAVLLIPAWYFLVRPICGASLDEYLLTMLSPLFAALLAMLLGYLASSYVTTPLSRIIVAALIAVPVYLAVSWIVNRSWVLAMRQLLFNQ